MPLFVKPAEAPPLREWHEYAKRLRLPTVDDEHFDDRRQKPPFEPFEPPPNRFGTRIRDGGFRPRFPEEGSAPKGIMIGSGHIGGEAAARISTLKYTWADWVVHGSILGLPICYLAVAWFLPAVWTWWAGAPAILVLLAESLFLYLLSGCPPEILIGRSRVKVKQFPVYTSEGPSRDGIELRLADMENIEIGESRHMSGESSLFIATKDHEVVEIVVFQSDQGRAWLRDYLIAAVARV